MSALIVEKIGPLATVQDLGRRGHAHEGVPASGPLDVELFDVAVGAVGTDVALELPLLGARFRVEGTVTFALDDDEPRTVENGILEIPPHARAVRYLALRGGIDVPRVLGSRATLVTAALGGHLGRPLARGDRLALGGEVLEIRAADRGKLRLDDETLEAIAVHGARSRASAFFARSYRIDPRSDRTGTRLRGEPVETPRGELLSRPLVPGAVQIPPDGQPIVIGPDGPTTGGYPVVAVLTASSRARLARLRPGATAKFLVKTPP